MSDVAIRAEGLGKQYHIGRLQTYGGYKTIRETVMDLCAAPVRRVGRLFRGYSSVADQDETMWALRDVSFQVRQGETVGIIGRNGSGKSTLLKILSRITEPSQGWAEVHGRVASLLEVGTGFHPELTGRENIFLNGAVLGMRRAEIQRKFEEIVAFAEIERFLDTPVKHYSSGMYVRLAFAVAAHLEPEILLVDEVLAVGDVAFQKKCLGRMEQVATQGRTVLFVSHNMGAVQGLCKRAILLDGGVVAADGPAREVVAHYLDAMQPGQVTMGESLAIEKVVLRNAAGEPTTRIGHGEPLTVEIHYHARERIEKPYFWVGIVSQHGSLMGANMLLDGARPTYIEGQGVLACRFHHMPLLPQFFTVRMGVRDHKGVMPLVRTADVAFFQVYGAARDLGLRGEIADVGAWDSAPVLIPYEWHLPDGRVEVINVAGNGSKGETR